MASSGWDDGYLQRYPKQQYRGAVQEYGHGVPNTLPKREAMPPTRYPSKGVSAVITRVEDADSFTATLNGKRIEIRLEGADAPEVAHTKDIWDIINPWSGPSRKFGYEPLAAIGKAFAQPFAWAGKERAEELIGAGPTAISLKEKDKYGRYVGDVITSDGKSLAQTLITEGLAHPYHSGDKFYSSNVFTPEVRDEWLDTVAKGKGIYSSQSYIMPVDYKHPTIGTILTMLNPFSISDAAKRDRELGRQYESRRRASELGLPTSLAPLVSGSQGFLLPASMGASYFYARGRYNALMRQAGLTENIIDSDDASMATSMYEVGYLARYGRMPRVLPHDIAMSAIAGALVGGAMGSLTGRIGGAMLGAVGGVAIGVGVGLTSPYVSQYDKELTSGGIGAALNEWGASNDWGRLYKDEVGFLPSLAGLVGRVLDRTYLYANPGGALWSDRDDSQQVTKGGLGYPKENTGFFETFLSKGVEIGMGAISSVALYLAIGEPVNVILGEVMKGEVESLINVGSSPESFKGGKVQGIFARQLTTGMGFDAKDVLGYREALLKEIVTTTRSDYEALEKARALVDYLSTTRKSVVGGKVIVKHDPTTSSGKAALEQAILDLQKVEGSHGMKGYYSLDRMGASAYHMVSLTRERAAMLIENTIKPFVLEHIDPYMEGSTGAKELRSKLTMAINEIRRPAFLDVEVNESSTRAISFMRDVMDRERQILKAHPNEANAYSIAREDVIKGNKYRDIEDDIYNLTYKLSNAGKERASNVASTIQEVLDMIPLPLTQWRAFRVGEGVPSQKDIKVLGDIFSFDEITNSIGRALHGTGGLSEYLREYRALTGVAGPDLGIVNALTSGPGRFLKYIRDRHEVVKSLEASSVAISKMERSLFEQGNIRWGHELPPDMVQKVEDDIVKAMKASHPKLNLASPKVQASIYKATQERLIPLVDPLVREITKLDNTLLEVLSMQGAQGTLGSRTMAILGETMRVRQHSSYMVGMSPKKLERIRAGWGRDATTGVTKGKLGTAAVTLLALSLFAEKLVRTTDGVSVFSQLTTALAMRAQGIQVSTEFKGDALLPTVAGVPLDYLVAAGLFIPSRHIAHAMQGQRVLSYAMRRDTVAHAIGMSKVELDNVLAGKVQHSKVSTLPGGMVEVELFPGVKSVLHMNGEVDEFMRLSMVALEGNRWRNTAAIWSLSLVGLTVATRAIASALNTSRSMTSSGTLDPLVLGAVGAIGAGGLLGRTMGGKGILLGMVVGGAVGASVGALTSGLREGREGTLDPIALGMVGVAVGKSIGGRGRQGVVGALMGGGLGLVAGMFTSFLKVGRDDWQTVNRKEGTILADMSTYVAMIRERARKGDASRLELMGAFYAMGWSKTLREGEVNKDNPEMTIGGKRRRREGNVQVVAKQAVLTSFLQVFMAETIKGTTYNEDGSVKTMGTSYYSIGVQGPIISGISSPIQLPFKVTRDGRGTLGLAMNENDNVGTFMGDVVSVRTAILTTLTGLGIITGTANVVQAGIRSLVADRVRASGSLATRTPLISNMLDGDWAKGVRGVVNALTDRALIIPSTALRITMSMTGVDYLVAGRAFMPRASTHRLPTPITDPSLYGRHIGRALIWGVLGAAIGSTVGGIISSNPDDPFAIQAGASAGGLIGASVGTGLYMATALTKETGLGAGIISRMGKVNMPLPKTLRRVLGRGGPTLALMATLGTLLTSSTFGVSVGMDKPRSWLGYQEAGNDKFNEESRRALEGEYFPSWVPLLGYKEPVSTGKGLPNLEAGGWTYQRAMTVGLYAAIGTGVMTLYGGMGKSAGDTMDEYMHLVRRKRPAPTDNLMAHVREGISKWRASHLEKDIDAILRRGYDIGGEALEGNLAHLHDASKVLYENKIYKAVDIVPGAPQEVNTAIEKIIQKGHGVRVGTRLLPDLLPRRAMRGATLLGVVALGIGVATTSMGSDTMDRVYDHLDSGNGLMRSLGDTLRLFTGTDRSIKEEALLAKQYIREGGFTNLLTKRKLLGKDKDLATSASSLWKQMSQLIVFDAPNAFVGIQMVGGVTLRRGEYGDRATPYLQVQGTGADLSTATYTMAASFLFNSVGNTQDLHFNMVNAMRELHTLKRDGLPITQAHLRRAAIGMLAYTAKAEPLSKPRKYSRPTNEVLSAAGKDPLLALALSHRQAVTRQMSYQPPESLISAMLKEQMNPAYMGVDSKLMGAILGGMQLVGDAFGNTMRTIRINKLTAFSISKDGLKSSPVPLQDGEWIEDEPVDIKDTPITNSPLWAPARMLLGVFPAPIAYTIGLTALGSIGMFAAASLGGFFLNREVNAIEEALTKHYSRPWYIPSNTGKYVQYPHRVGRVNSPPGMQLTPHPLYSMREGIHGTMFGVNSHLVDDLNKMSTGSSYKLVELVQDAINSSLTNNGVLFGDYMRTQPYLQHVASTAKGVHGKEARVGKLVDEISSPLMDVVDKYFKALESTSIDLGKVILHNNRVQHRNVPFLSLFTNASIDEVMANPTSWGSVHGEGFQASLRQRFADGMHPYNTSLDITGKAILDPVATYKEEIRKVIQDVVEEHIGAKGSLTKLAWGTVKGEEDGVLHLVQRSLHKLMDKGGPLGRMRHEWADIATPLPLDIADRFEDLLGESIDMGHNVHTTSPLSWTQSATSGTRSVPHGTSR